MTILTALMIVAILCLAPLSVSVGFSLHPNTKTCLFVIRVFGLPVMKEKLQLLGKYLQCSGTVDETLDLSAGGNTDIFKAVQLDELQLTFFVGCQGSAYNVIFVEMLAAAVAVVACVCKCKVSAKTCFSAQSEVRGKLKFGVSLVAIIVVLIGSAAQNLRQQGGNSGPTNI